MNIKNSTFTNILTAYSLNNPGTSGAIYIAPRENAAINILDCNFTNSTSKISGAGIYIDKII